MPLLNYTTKVNAQKTVTEVMGLLVAKGANEVSIVYNDNQQPAGLKWTVQSPRLGNVGFAPPCNIDAVFVKLTEQRVPFALGVLFSCLHCTKPHFRRETQWRNWRIGPILTYRACKLHNLPDPVALCNYRQGANLTRLRQIPKNYDLLVNHNPKGNLRLSITLAAKSPQEQVGKQCHPIPRKLPYRMACFWTR